MSTKPRKRLTAAARREVIEQAARDVFAERGYHGASMEEIARRSGITPPVLYDHFASKVALHRRLLERTRDELLAMWREHLAGEDPPAERVPRALDAWARYVQANPYAPRMFFNETTGNPEIAAIHREIRMEASGPLGVIVGQALGPENVAGADPLELEMAAEVIRGGLTALAVWWTEHPEVPREQIVDAAVNAVWLGFGRLAGADGAQPG